MIYCKDCALCHEVDMFGQRTLLECRRTELITQADGFCKWCVPKEEEQNERN